MDAVSSALANASLDKQSLQRVLIQSDDSSVLLKFKDVPTYERVFYLEQSISGAPEQVAQEVKKYADAVFVHRDAIVVASDNFAFNFTKTVPAFHAANISVYVGVLKNEFENFIFDYLSDPYVEISSFYSQQVDGFVTDYPATANMFASKSFTKPNNLLSKLQNHFFINVFKSDFLLVETRLQEIIAQIHIHA